MQTIQLDIHDDKLDLFLTIIQNLKDDIVKNIKIKDEVLNIESIEGSSEDYSDIQVIKSQNNPKYSLNDAKRMLGL